MFLNQACALWPHMPGFLKSFLFAHRYVCVCVSVCVFTTRALITSGMIWCDICQVWLVKPILQLFRIFLSINWKGVALATQCVMHTRQRCWSWCRTSHRMSRINYLVVATRQSASVIKVNGWICNDKFKTGLGFSFHSNNLGLK